MVFIRTHVLGIGNADSIILELPSPSRERRIGIVDCGDYKYTRDYIERMNINPSKVQFVVATHPHRDHISGLVNLLKYFRNTMQIDVESYWDSGHYLDKATYHRLQKYIEEHLSDRVIFPHDQFDSFQYGPVEINVLAPLKRPNYEKSITNNMSIVLSLKNGRSKILLGGDAQVGSWSQILSRKRTRRHMRASFMKIAHHGSIRGTDPDSIGSYVVPKVAVITGKKCMVTDCVDDHCFPDPNIASLIKKAHSNGVKTLNTFNHGDIVVESHGNGSVKYMYSRKETRNPDGTPITTGVRTCPLEKPTKTTCAVSDLTFKICPLT